MPTILICDDEAPITNGLRYFLQARGYRVRTARDGDEALGLIEQEKPDLLLLDVMMPRKSGFEVLAELRSRPETRDLPVIVLTARGQKGDALYASRLGVADFITKPFSLMELSDKLGKLLATGQDRREQAEPSSSSVSSS